MADKHVRVCVTLTPLFVLAIFSACHLRTALAISCWTPDLSTLAACQAAGTCDVEDMSTSDINVGNLSSVSFALPPGSDPMTYDPPYTPMLNTTEFTTCFYVIIRYNAPAATSPPLPDSLGQMYGNTPAPGSGGYSPDGSDGDTPAPGSGGYSPDGSDDDSGDDDDDGDLPPLTIIQSGSPASDLTSPLRTYRSCMDTWGEVKAEVMLIALFVPGLITMDFMCCTSSACNYNLDGAAPTGMIPSPLPAPPRPPSPRPPRSPSPPPVPPMAPQPTGYTGSSSGGMIALQVFLVLLVVVGVAGSVWFFCKDRQKEGDKAKAMQLAGQGQAPTAQVNENTVLLGADRL